MEDEKSVKIPLGYLRGCALLVLVVVVGLSIALGYLGKRGYLNLDRYKDATTHQCEELYEEYFEFDENPVLGFLLKKSGSLLGFEEDFVTGCQCFLSVEDADCLLNYDGGDSDQALSECVQDDPAFVYTWLFRMTQKEEWEVEECNELSEKYEPLLEDFR